MRLSIRNALLGAGPALCLGAGTAEAAVIFQDNFNAEHGGVGTLNDAGLGNWTVNGGSVDLVGNGFFDFLPGNGLYIDLNGSTNQGGTITSTAVFAPGTYLLSFDLAGTQRGPAGIVTVTLGELSQTITLGSGVGFTAQHFVAEVTTASPRSLSFASGIPGGNLGGLLDNVVVMTRDVFGVPEPGSALLLGAGLLGLGLLRGLVLEGRREGHAGRLSARPQQGR